MKKIVLNISEIEYEKFRFEALHKRKSIPEVLKDRLFHERFSEEVEESWSEWLEYNLTSIMKEDE